MSVYMEGYTVPCSARTWALENVNLSGADNERRLPDSVQIDPQGTMDTDVTINMRQPRHLASLAIAS